MTYIYDESKATLREEIGEIAIPPRDLAKVKIAGVAGPFAGFDRNPFVVSFQAKRFQFQLVNVHLYFGSDKQQADIDRRCLEAFAVARWADDRRNDADTYCRDVIVLGDFNLPKVDPANPVYKALTAKGLHLPLHSTHIGSSIASESHYDQLAFFPADTPEYTGNAGVFDWDGALFKKL
jgi:endonuclease/exonuclease/phosphatase family metal-dependent hydrolase